MCSFSCIRLIGSFHLFLLLVNVPVRTKLTKKNKLDRTSFREHSYLIIEKLIFCVKKEKPFFGDIPENREGLGDNYSESIFYPPFSFACDELFAKYDRIIEQQRGKTLVCPQVIHILWTDCE